MPSPRFLAATAVGLSAAIAAAVGAPAVAVAAPAHTQHGVHVHVTSRNLVAGPHRTAPGMTHLVNSGVVPVIALEQKRAGVDVLAADLERADGKAGPGKLLHDFRMLDVLDGHSAVYLRLRRGTVYLVDAAVAHPSAAKITGLTVTGPARNATLPPSSPITIDRRRALHAAAMLPRHGYLHLHNRSNRLIDLLVVTVGKNVSTATLRHFVNHPDFTGIDDVSPDFALSFVGVMPPASSVYQDQRSPEGRAVLIAIPLTAKNAFTLHKAGVRGVLFG